MEYQNMIHRTTTPGNTLFTSPDGKVYRLFSYNGNTIVSPSGGHGHGGPQPQMTLQHPSHSSQTLASMLSGGQMSPMAAAAAANGSLPPPPKQMKAPPQSTPHGRSGGISRGSSEQTDKLMSLLLYKDGQIAALTTRVESLRAELDSRSLRDKKASVGIGDLRSELESKQREAERLSQELADMRAGKKKVVSEKIKLEKHLTGKFSEMNNKIGRLEGEVEVLRKAKVEIWDEKRVLSQRLEASESMCKAKSESLERTSEALAEAKSMAQRVEQEKRKLDSERKKLEKGKEEAFQTVQVLKKVVAQKESRIDHLQGRMKSVTKESNKKGSGNTATAACNCKQEKEELRRQLQEREESEARLGDMLAKSKNQITCLSMEKEKARTQMIAAWESESNLRSELEREKAARESLEKTTAKQEGKEDKKAVLQGGMDGNAGIRLGLYKAKNAKLKKQIRELEQKLDTLGDGRQELSGDDKEERCKRLYKDLVRYKVSPANCRKVTQCVLENLLDRSMDLPGKEFAWSAQQDNPPTPHVSDEEGDGSGNDGAVKEVVYPLSDDDVKPGQKDEGKESGGEEEEAVDVPSSPEKRKAALTRKLDHYGGLWCTPREMEDQLRSLDEKNREEAVVVQLQYRSVVLELAREGKLLHSSATGKRKPFPELKRSLSKLIQQNRHQDSFMKENNPRRGAPVKEEEEEELIKFSQPPEEEENSSSLNGGRKRNVCSPGPDHAILRPRKKQHSSRRSRRSSSRKVPLEDLHGKMVEHFVHNSDGHRDWHTGVVIEAARSSLSVLYDFSGDCRPVKISLRDARQDFDRGDLVACEVTLEDFVGKVIENLWEMDGGVTEWYKGHVVKMGVPRGEETEFEVAYGGSLDDEFYYVPLLKDYWCNEVRIMSL